MRTARGRRAGGLPRGVSGGVLLALLAGPAVAPAAAVPATPDARGATESGTHALEIVLDSSGSMARATGSGGTRMESARDAVGTLVDSLPDGYPTGLRVYGADRAASCTDTRLVEPVGALDRAGIKKAVSAVRPKGETPIGPALRKAADDLPDPPRNTLGRRTIVLVSDGEDTCGDPEPCEVAEELSRDGLDLRIDTIGFQVRGEARKQLECIAEAGHGEYYDAPEAEDLARELERAGRQSAAGYRFEGRRVAGARSSADAPALRAPGQYLDTIGPGETRWYSTELGAGSTARAVDLAATGVPRPGARVGSTDGLELTMRSPDGSRCGNDRSWFAQDEGGVPLTAAVSRIPDGDGARSCDRPGRFTFELTRATADGSDRARWPVELQLGTERALPGGVAPARAETGYGPGGEDAALPTGAPRDIEGGTGFNDAKKLRAGVWRDTLVPAQTRWYRVPVGWNQQLRYDVEFANEPARPRSGGVPSSSVWTELYAPGRLPVPGGAEFTTRLPYRGEPVKVSHGTVPVSWRNRTEPAGSVRPVRRDGDYYVAVTLGAGADRIAAHAAVRVVLRVDVKGRRKRGPEHDAPYAGAGGAADGRSGGRSAGSGTSGSVQRAAGGVHPAVAAAGGAAAVLLAAGGAGYALRRRARVRSATATRGGTW